MSANIMGTIISTSEYFVRKFFPFIHMKMVGKKRRSGLLSNIRFLKVRNKKKKKRNRECSSYL